MKRRDAIKTMGALSAAPVLLRDLKEGENGDNRRILVAGGHPDDPETGCGGTLALLADMGYRTIALYLTKGEAGIPGISADEAASIRMREAEKACSILKAEASFLDQIDGSTYVNNKEYNKIEALIREVDPIVVFTQWPIDSHPDHRTISLLIYDAWLQLRKSFALYYYEVMTGSQTQLFHPTDYVDITAHVEQKRRACFQHQSQSPEEWYSEVHEKMSLFRGWEAGCQHAEAFIRHPQTHNDRPMTTSLASTGSK